MTTRALTGGVVGTISARPAGGALLTDPRDGVNFAIGGLGFRTAISDKNPYERATAQFRKEQFDAAPTVGDQSLTGWWTRGQMSFHRGAGVRFYEVLDGETILNRFNASTGIDPTEPGKVVLQRDLVDTGLAASDASPGEVSGVAGVFVLNAAGLEFWDGGASSAITTSNAAVPTALTSDGKLCYVANGNKLERLYSAAFTRTNYVTNPSLETNATGWTTGASVARVTTGGLYGPAAMQLSAASVNTSVTVSGLTIGQAYRVSVMVKVGEGSDILTLTASEGAGDIASVSSDLVGEWELLSFSYNATATSVTVKVTSGPDYVDPSLVDAMLVTEAPYDGEFFDGTTPGGAWTGTAHASTSTYGSATATDTVVLWQHSDAGVTWAGVWWAKGRLWAVDNHGRWYTLAGGGGSVTAQDAVWFSGQHDGTWTLTEGPGAVYVSHGPDVYAVSVDASGVVPVIDVPAVAASLPSAETVAAVSYYLGHLVIASNKGVRVAVIGQGAELVYGPLVIEGDFSKANSMARQGSKVTVVGIPKDATVPAACVLDLGSIVTDLQPAWHQRETLGTATTGPWGAIEAGEDVYAWSGADLYGTGNALVSSGSLTTGYHRFGTLEPKQFHAVKVRVGGTGGTVAIQRVMADGAVVTLFTINVATSTSEDITLGVAGVQEMLALRFTLAPKAGDATVGPELLGYQLKALPAPRRQRLIRVPLMLFDVETNSPARGAGREGQAWSRLRSLEELEEQGGTHMFQDFRTGETGVCYIERVEHTGATPPGARDSGYGGVVFLTIRKIDR